MRTLWSEARIATRSLARTPIVAVGAIFCLSLGIGATTAISSAISRAMLSPLPFRDAGELVAVHRVTPQSGPDGTWPQSPANYVDMAREARQIDRLSAMTFGTALVNLPDASIEASQVYVTGDMFPMLGASAQAGRLLLPDDDTPDAATVAVISDEFWRGQFGGDPALVGQNAIIDGEPTTIVGVLPPDFRIPHAFSVITADVWMPMRFTPDRLSARRNNFLFLVGRLAEGATVATAGSELEGVFANLVAAYPELNGENVRVAPLRAENVAAVRKPLFLVFGAVAMVLLIAATNVAALLLARGVHRRREVAVRTSLGATRWDNVRPVLLESGVITGISVVLGLALAGGAVKTIGALASARMPQLDGLSLDWRVVAFAIVLAIAVAVICGAVPAWRNTAVDPQDALRSARGGAGREHHRLLRSLVVTEIALSVILLIGAGLVLKGFAGLLANDPGFPPERLLTLRMTTPAARHPEGTAVRSFVRPAVAAIGDVPGVEAAAAISSLPYRAWGNNSNIRYEGMPGDDPTRLPIVEQRRVTPRFFEVTGQRLVSGRLLLESDDERPESPQVVVVNEALVRRDFDGRDAIGQRFHLSDTTFATIVGVVSDIRNAGPFREAQPEMYWTYAQRQPSASSVTVLVRTRSGDPASVASAVRQAVRDVDAEAAVARVETMNEVIADSLGRPRFYFSLLGTFAGIAIVLAMAGLYGVLSYAVAQRTREIGIRSALGGSRGALVRLFAAEGLRLVGLGLMLGIAGGMAATRLMEFMLYGVSPLDAGTWAAAAALMIVAALGAVLVPALRAARVNPAIAMQAE